MTQKTDPKKQPSNKDKKTKKHDWSFYAIIICLVIIAIPTSYIGITSISAFMQRGKPIVGNRFDDEPNPKIQDAQVKSLADTIGGVANVETANVNVVTSTVRVNIKVSEDLAKDSYDDVAQEAYAKIVEALPVETYFTSDEDNKRYDIEINIYNILKPTEEQADSAYHYLYAKNSTVEQPSGQFLSEAISPEMVEKLKEAEEARKKEKEAGKQPAEVPTNEAGTDTELGE